MIQAPSQFTKKNEGLLALRFLMLYKQIKNHSSARDDSLEIFARQIPIFEALQ